jgi:hypothetical protein
MSWAHPYFSGDVKQCSVCKDTKAIESYSRKSGTKDGHQNICKACVNTRLLKKDPVKYDKRAGKYFKYET